MKVVPVNTTELNTLRSQRGQRVESAMLELVTRESAVVNTDMDLESHTSQQVHGFSDEDWRIRHPSLDACNEMPSRSILYTIVIAGLLSAALILSALDGCSLFASCIALDDNNRFQHQTGFAGFLCCVAFFVVYTVYLNQARKSNFVSFFRLLKTPAEVRKYADQLRAEAVKLRVTAQAYHYEGVDLDDRVTHERTLHFEYGTCEDRSGDFLHAAEALPVYRLAPEIEFDFAAANGVKTFEAARRTLLDSVREKDSKCRDFVMAELAHIGAPVYGIGSENGTPLLMNRFFFYLFLLLAQLWLYEMYVHSRVGRVRWYVKKVVHV